MAEIKWIKIVTDIFDNRKIKQIETLPEGDTIVVIWFKLLCLSGRINDKGHIYLTQEVPYTEEMLSTEFNRPLKTIQLAMRTFQAFGMVEIIDDIYRISNWEDYQNVDGMEKIREQNRIRKQRQREKERLLLPKGHVTSRDSHATDIDKEIDIDINNIKDENGCQLVAKWLPQNSIDKISIDKEKEKQTKKTNFDIMIEKENFQKETIERLNDFIKMRKSIKKPLTDRALKIIINKLKKMSQNEEEMQMILDRSILNSWQDIYELKPEDKKKVISQKEEYQDVIITEEEYYQRMKGKTEKYE